MADMENSPSEPPVKVYNLTNSFENGLGSTPTGHGEDVCTMEDNVSDQHDPYPKRRKTDTDSGVTTTSSTCDMKIGDSISVHSDPGADRPVENFKPTDIEDKNPVEGTEANGIVKDTKQGTLGDSTNGTSSNREERDMASLLQTFIAESKMLHNSWAQLFSNSERFEQYSMERLDKLLQDAKAYETHLKKQKSLLRERLLALSQALHMA